MASARSVLFNVAGLLMLGSLAFLSHQQGERVEALARELSQSRGSCEPKPAVEAPMPMSAPVARVSLSEAELEALAQRVAGRMAEHLRRSEAPGTPPEAPPAPPPSPLTPVQQVAVEEASLAVDDVIASGRMSVEDVKDLRKKFQAIGRPEEVRPLVERIAVAINQQRLVPPNDPFFGMP